MPPHLIRDRAGLPPFVQPFLNALDRMQERQVFHPDRLNARARDLMTSRLGTSHERIESAFAHGSIGLVGEHTHYFDGFALLLNLPMGAAVALRRTEEPVSHILFEGGERTWTFDVSAAETPAERNAMPSWVLLTAAIARRMGTGGSQVEIAVVSTVHASCMDAYLASLSVATARSLQALFALPDDRQALFSDLRTLAADSVGCPFSLAPLMASDGGHPDVYTLVDTHTFEQLPLPAPSNEVLGWGLVDLGSPLLREPAFYVQRKQQADEAVEILRESGLRQLTSFRDLEHRDLQYALDLLPRRLRPLVRHLVTENRRVQKLVAAVRRRDWQMFGALLLMSHASRRNDWGSTSEETDLVVEQVERMSIEGMYGAGMTGRGGCVLVAGQPFIVPRCLDRISVAIEERFEFKPDTLLL